MICRPRRIGLPASCNATLAAGVRGRRPCQTAFGVGLGGGSNVGSGGAPRCALDTDRAERVAVERIERGAGPGKIGSEKRPDQWFVQQPENEMFGSHPPVTADARFLAGVDGRGPRVIGVGRVRPRRHRRVFPYLL